MAKVLIGNFKGPKGDQGVKGDPGTAASIQVGTTQTVQPEENAEIINTGTTTAAVLNFKIPRGEDGMTDLTAEYKDDSSYACQPTVNAPVVVKGLDGKTEQVETTGAQLFDMENYDFKTSRCTISKSSDYIIFTATAADAYFGDAIGQGMVIDKGALPVSPNTEYTVTISNNYFTKNYISFLDSNKTGIQDYLNFTSQSQSFTTPDNCTYILLRFGNGNSVNGDTERFKIMFNKGSTALPWEPYTGGSPAPSPDYPQVIKGVGGMGYFDGTFQSVWYDSSGNPTPNINYYSSDKIECNAGDVIKVEYEQNVDALLLYYWNANGEYISYDSAQNSNIIQKSAPTNTKYFAFSVNAPNIGNSPAKYCTVTINGKYQTGVEVHGANLIDANTFKNIFVEIISGAESSSNMWVSTDFVPINPSTEYYFAVGIYGNYVIFYDSNKQIIDGKSIRLDADKSLISPDNSSYFKLRFYNNDSTLTVSRVADTKPMVNEGSEPLPYQPYHHTALTIPLTSPLYSGDKICYVKPGESYIDADGDTVVADRILYGVYRENAVVVFDGSEDEAWKDYTDETFRGFKYTIKNMKKSSFNDGFCDLFFVEKEVSNNNPGIWLGSTAISTPTSDMFVHNVNPTYATDVNSWKTWLQSHNMTVVYPIATPYFEPFVDQSIFYALRTDDTITYIYSNDPIEPVLTVEVAKNSTGGYLLESYAQAQKNAISEANSQSRLSAIEQQLVNQATTLTE